MATRKSLTQFQIKRSSIPIKVALPCGCESEPLIHTSGERVVYCHLHNGKYIVGISVPDVLEVEVWEDLTYDKDDV